MADIVSSIKVESMLVNVESDPTLANLLAKLNGWGQTPECYTGHCQPVLPRQTRRRMSLLRVHRMMIRRILLTLAACSLVAGSARAQEPGPPPAYISYIDGTATIQRDGEILAATQNMP